MEQRIGGWIETYSGGMFYPLDPRPEEINLIDIAHGYSLVTRFGGQCKYLFPVGQHVINVVKEVRRLTSRWDKFISIKAQALAALHDASEVLGIGDVCSPAKKSMREYQKIEANIQDAIWKAFDLEHTTEEYEIVDIVDKAMAAYEAKHVMNCTHWDIGQSYLVHMDERELKHINVSLRDPHAIKAEFLYLAESLLRRYKRLKERNKMYVL